MTVKQLKELLEGCPDDLPVFIADTTEIGGFLFKPACNCETGSGIMEIPETEDEDSELISVFALIPHGIGFAQGEEPEETDEVNPNLN